MTVLAWLRRLLTGSTGVDGYEATPDYDEELRAAANEILQHLVFSDDSTILGQPIVAFSPDAQQQILASIAGMGAGDGLFDEDRFIDERLGRMREARDIPSYVEIFIERCDEDQRVIVVEIMWQALENADILPSHREALLRKIASVPDLHAAYLATIRKRASPHPKG